MQLLQNALDMPLCANQLQFGVMHTPMIDFGVNVNMANAAGVNRDAGNIEYCRLNNITIQPWSPMQHGFFKGCFIDNEKFPELNKTLKTIGEKYGVSATTMAVAWLLRHPANMQVLAGTMSLDRFDEICKASDVKLERADWYKIYMSAGNILP